MTSTSNHYLYHQRSTSPQTSISTLGFVSWSSCCNEDQSCPSPAPLWPLRERCWLKSAKWSCHMGVPPETSSLALRVLDSTLWTLSSYNPTESQFGYSALIPLAGADSGYCNARPVDHRGSYTNSREGVLHSILADMSLEI